MRLHTTYLSSLAQWTWGRWSDGDNKKWRTTRYRVHYILHTGALWRGPIGTGEVYLYHAGERHLVRRFTRLEPTVKDDISLELGFRVIDWEGYSDKGREIRGRITDLRLRLPNASGHLASPRVDTHVGLVVDGDPETHWVSPRGAALRSFVQLPAGRARRLRSVRITSGKRPRGAVRPSRLVVSCRSRRRSRVLARVSLPDSPGPHTVRLKRSARCAAIRVQVTGVHGSPKASVAIAEIEQQFARKSRWRPKRAKRPRSPFAGVRAGARRTDELAFDRAGVDRVMWSRDGALLHYRLHLENVRPPFGGFRLGYVVDVATGKVVRTYRLARSGKLPPQYARDWRRAWPFERGEALLRKRGFRPAIGSRRTSRGANPAEQSVRLRGRVARRAGTLAIQATEGGFRWTFGASPRPAARTAQAALELLYRRPRQKERLLARRARRIDLRFAARHAAVWRARRPYFKTLVQVFRDQWAYDSQHIMDKLPPHVWKRMPQVWHLLTYPHREAYGGEVRLFWEPRGHAVAALWIDRKDHSSFRRVEKRSVFKKDKDGVNYLANYDKYISACARDVLVMVCPWERRGDPRHRLAVTVHALRKRAARPRAPAVIRPPKSGCGCAAGAGGAGGAALLLLLLAFALLRRHGRTLRIGAAAVALGALMLPGPAAHARSARARAVRLRAFFDVHIPAGGRPYGPRAMRRVMLMVHYPRSRRVVVKQLRTLLRAHKWRIAKRRVGAGRRPYTADFLQLWLRKGRRRVRLVVIRRNQASTVIFVTRHSE